MSELAVIIPTRGRPENIRKVIAAWDFTCAWDVADMVLAIDADDPEHQRYVDLFEETRNPDTGAALFSICTMDQWVPMVHKLNLVADNLALTRTYFALGFAGDDHLPQTINWAKRYLAVLHELGTGMVYGDDGFQGANLSTEWAVTADAVRSLGRMVPADVEHMYCDNSMMDLFGGAGALRHLPEVRIEHMHPIAGKAENDDQYKRVNHRDQFKKDKRAYDGWRHGDVFRLDVAEIRHLRAGRPDTLPVKVARPPAAGSMPRAVPPRPRGNRPVTRFGIPRHFKRVRGATPDEIGVTLADFASQVPYDQAIVELGVFQGRTALLMAWGAAQGNQAHVYGVDAWNLPGNTYGPPFNELGSRTWAEYNVMALGFKSGITLIQDFAVPCAQNWVHDKPIGLLFVDDDHSYAGARGAVTAWAPHLAPGAVIAIDDYGHPDWPGVAEAVDALVEEGFLAPLQIFHDRLAVTRLAESAGERSQGGQAPTAITSEGVSPSPYPAVDGQVAVDPTAPQAAEVWVETDNSVSTDLGPEFVREGEVGSIAPGTSIEGLNLGQLRALSKARGIVLGRRKDLKADIIQALRDGQ